MKIIEILAKSAMLLGLEDEHLLLKEAQTTQEDELLENAKIQSLFSLIKYSLQELCTNYIPVVTKIEKQSDEKYIQIKDIENFIRVQNVTKNGENVKYKIINRKIYFEKDDVYCVEYLTYPTITSLFDEIDFLSKFSEDVIVCSVCAYFSLAHGMFDEFKEFHELYIDKAENIKELKNFNLPQRRWE